MVTYPQRHKVVDRIGGIVLQRVDINARVQQQFGTGPRNCANEGKVFEWAAGQPGVEPRRLKAPQSRGKVKTQGPRLC